MPHGLWSSTWTSHQSYYLATSKLWCIYIVVESFFYNAPIFVDYLRFTGRYFVGYSVVALYWRQFSTFPNSVSPWIVMIPQYVWRYKKDLGYVTLRLFRQFRQISLYQNFELHLLYWTIQCKQNSMLKTKTKTKETRKKQQQQKPRSNSNIHRIYRGLFFVVEGIQQKIFRILNFY